MNSSSEIDADKKFQEDIEKATALSLETLALDQFRRTKLYSNIEAATNRSSNSKSSSPSPSISESLKKFQTSNAPRSRPGSFNSGTTRQFSVSNSSNDTTTTNTQQGVIAPPPTVPPRRHSEIHYTAAANKSTVDDLISFNASPEAKQNETNDNFDKLIEDIQRLNSQVNTSNLQQQYNQHQSNFNFGSSPSLAAVHLFNHRQQQQQQQQQTQIVPYNPSTTQPLTNDELQKLYNMPVQVQSYRNSVGNSGYYSSTNMLPYMQPAVGNTAPIGQYPTYRMPTPPPPTYGFQMHLFPQPGNFNQNYSSPPPPNTESNNQTSQNVSNFSSISKSISLSGISSMSILSNYSNSSTSKNPEVQRRSKNQLRNDDLIDLEQEETSSRVSVLEAFDPLSSSNDYDENCDAASDCTSSYYAESDPFDYLYSCGTQYSDPVYEAVNKTDRTPNSPSASIGWRPDFIYPENVIKSKKSSSSPPPLPPRNSTGAIPITSSPTTSSTLAEIETTFSAVESKSSQSIIKKQSFRLYEIVTDRVTIEPELMAFYYMVKNLRNQYVYDDTSTNVGHVVASEFNNHYSDEKSIKLIVHPALDIFNEIGNRSSEGHVPGYGSPVIFTCNTSTTVEFVLMQVFCALEGQIIGTVNNYAVKPINVMEWLSNSSKLNQLECVHESIKLERDVQLGFCLKNNDNMMAISRTLRDDESELKPENILTNEIAATITYDLIMILIETLESEIDKLIAAASDANPHSILSSSGVVQGVKAICALMGYIDSLDLCQNIEELKGICMANQTVYTYGSANYPDIVSECGDYAEVKLRPKSTLDSIKLTCDHIRENVQDLIDIYSKAFRVNFCIKSIDYGTTPIPVSCVLKPVIVNISCLHRIPPNWKYDDYKIGAQIYHGTRFIGEPLVTQCSNDTSGGLFPRLKFNAWINFEKNPICTLPRESRLIFVLYGTQPAENDDGGKSKNNDEANAENKKISIELGWCAVQLFDFSRQMICGTYLLSLWPPTTDKFLGPAPAKGSHPQSDFCPVLSIEVPTYGGIILFPETQDNPHEAPRYDFNSLDCNLQQELLDTAEQGYPGALDKREVFWEKRHYLQDFPHALPKVLHAAHSWDYASLMDLHLLLKSWRPLSPLQALELLLPRYPDLEVRAKAVEWISKMSNDQLVDFLPQLLQALKHDTYEASPMSKFILSKCLESPRIAHHLYWLLIHSLPGDSPQNSIDTTQTTSEFDESLITQARYHRRNKMMLRALLAICGEKLSSRFLKQNMICTTLAEVAQNVKQCKESMRQKVLIHGLESINQILQEAPTSLPLGPGLEVYGIHYKNCNYFNSNTLPLKVAFNGPDSGIVPAIFKAGDDLQQDMLTIQLVRVMDKLWLEEGLDLKMLTFNCIPTGFKKGMIELVTEAETLRKIQVEYGLTGSFKDRPIAEWLAKQNASQLEYQRAVDNFTVSCAGYSVATYILGICDRHNDNIMLKTSGHLFHIDFGKFLGDAQMFGNFKRDRTPFVLTSDMAYVINGGEKPSTQFHHFVDLCCRAFNIIRNHGDLILHMLALMATAGIPGVTADAVTYVRRALLPSQSNPEAAASFAKMIQFSLKSWFTQFNFFLHNLAQLRFSNDDGGGELLSFVPRKYTMQQEGRLKNITVHNCQKRYDVEKYYTYILRVTRHGHPDAAFLFRTYKEFLEFHQMLCLHFPLAKLHSLPSGIHMGRSNIKTVAVRRQDEIQKFLKSLFDSADEIAHSDLVYTFFHPLLRDQQEADITLSKVKEVKKPTSGPSQNLSGEIKISLQYRRGALTVMIHHAKNLPTLTGGQEPNTYVKCYLKPDPNKATKRKTKVVRKTCVPSFMETLEYRMPLEHIQNRTLQVTIWSHDTLQENELLGGCNIQLSTLDLTKEFIQWFRLGNVSRT